MNDVLDITPISRPVRGTVRPPGSKSLTNRALILAALAQGRSRLTNVLDSDDTRVMVDSLQKLGIDLSWNQSDETIDITGCAGRPPATAANLWVENSGTSVRFLTALCTLGQGDYELDGNARMRERPIKPLVEALNELGSQVECVPETGCPPVKVHAHGLGGGEATVAGDLSSQYLSGLLMAAPGAKSAITLAIQGTLVSRPYVEMTRALMQAFGASVSEQNGAYVVEPQTYRATEYPIEPDASSASYFFAAAAVTGGEVTVEGLSRNSRQGDVQFVEALERMGCQIDWHPTHITVRGGTLRGIDIDMNEISDTALTLAAIAPLASGPTRIRNIAHVRHKETDRVHALVTELRRLGLTIDEYPDGLTIHPGPLRPATISTYDDHRMAMSFAILGLVAPGIGIANPECTAKTYPHFFNDLSRLCGSN